MTSYRTIRAAVTAEIEVSRSRFRCHLHRIADEPQARELIAGYRREYWDSRHVCSAFLIADGSIERSNDDGEPAGTAGAPMLAALRGAEVNDVVAIVVRWFGGVLLGTGGLTRAYGDSVRAALAEAELLERRWLDRAVVEVDIAEAGRLENALRRRGFAVEGTDYDRRALVRVAFEPGQDQSLAGLVAEATGGAASITSATGGWLDWTATT